VLAKKEKERKTTKIKHYPDKHTHTYTDNTVHIQVKVASQGRYLVVGVGTIIIMTHLYLSGGLFWLQFNEEVA